ncbi:4312_t:CDS:1, partial [Gigaspora rosea]
RLSRPHTSPKSRPRSSKNSPRGQNERELETAYDRIKDSELYKKGGPSKKVIKNLRPQVKNQITIIEEQEDEN